LAEYLDIIICELLKTLSAVEMLHDSALNKSTLYVIDHSCFIV